MTFPPSIDPHPAELVSVVQGASTPAHNPDGSVTSTSDWLLTQVAITGFEPIEGADAIHIAQMSRRGVPMPIPVVVRKADFSVGDKALYIPSDSVLPDEPEFAFLSAGERKRTRPKRLRGVYSEGMLLPMVQVAALGARHGGNLGIHRWLPPERGNGFFVAPGGTGDGPPCFIPTYSVVNLRHGDRDFDGLARDTRVIATEKIHGCNFRAGHLRGSTYLGSHKKWRTLDGGCPFAEVFASYGMDERLRRIPGIFVLGEMFGEGLQDLHYGRSRNDRGFRLFDAWNADERRWLSWAELRDISQITGFDIAPVLYDGPYGECLPTVLAEGKTTLGGTDHVREGVVVKTSDGKLRGKWVSQGYKLRAKGQDFTDE